MLTDWIDYFGDEATLTLAGALIGVLFGAAAQRSRFCLRAATAEVAEGTLGTSLAVWLLAFTAAVALVQCAVLTGWLETGEARQIASAGSISGALVGGLMFGAGMILARGCASRLLVLSATGNLRAMVTGLVLTLTAQASLRGVLAPLREALAGLWLIPGGESRDLTQALGLSATMAAGLAALGLIGALWLAHRHRVAPNRLLAAGLVGLAVAAGWGATSVVAQTSFEVVPVSSITFTGPSADTLMALVNERAVLLNFGAGLVPGVFLGALLMALITREARIQRFEPDMPMERYLIGGMLMGFGSMLAGGCAVGAGLSGGAIFALTAWLALVSMWIGAVATQVLMVARARPGEHRITA